MEPPAQHTTFSDQEHVQEDKKNNSGKRFGQRHYLIGKSDTETEENPADDQHGDVASKGVKQSAGAEENTSQEHGKFPSQFSGDI